MNLELQRTNSMGLATLLEGAGCFIFKVNFNNYILFKNGCFKAVKLEKSDI